MRVEELRSQLAELAEGVPPARQDPLRAWRPRPRRRRVRLVGLAGGLAAVVALFIGLVLLAPHGGDERVVAASAGPGPCPSEPPDPASPVPPPPDRTGRRLVVPGPSAQLNVCRYSGMLASPPRALTDQRLVTDGAAVARLRAAINALPAFAPYVSSCPMDDASAIRLDFGAGQVAIAWLRGCPYVTSATGSAPLTEALLSELAALAPGTTATTVAPVTTVAPAPAPAPGGGPPAPPCATSQLTLGPAGPVSPPTGQRPLALTVDNQSAAACSLGDYARVTLYDAGGAALPFEYQRSGDQVVAGGPATAVEVPAGGAAYLTVNKYRCDLGAVGRAVRVEVAVPGDRLPLRLDVPPDSVPLDYCGPGDPGSIVHVSPFGPTLRSTLRSG